MFNWIEKMREKSEGYRRGMALGISFVVTLAIFGVWMAVIFPDTVSQQTLASRAQKGDSPGTTFGRNMASVYESAKVEFTSVYDYFMNINYEAKNELQVIDRASNQPVNYGSNLGSKSSTKTDGSVVY